MGTFDVFSTIKFFFLSVNVAVARGADIRFYDRSFDTYSVYSFDNLPSILNSSTYDPYLNTVIFVFGYNSSPESDAVKSIVGVYGKRANTCVLNWEKEASSGILGPIAYRVTAIPNAKKVGDDFGEALVELNNAGLDLSRIHVIGYSLGGQLVGYAGRKVQEYGRNLSRITGFDPAGPAYDDIDSLHQLSSSDAMFVDIIHTNPARFGSREATGTVDIWVNCGSNLQPGCTEDSCSHDHSWRYFCEALERPYAFKARAAQDCDAWKAGRGNNQTIFMGDNIDTNARGNFYLRTNSEPLFGLGEEGSQPAS